MKNPDFEILGRRIEEVIEDHIRACRQVALEAIERSFMGSAAVPLRSKSTRTERAASNGPRRTRADLSQLGERLYTLVCERPGETITVLAPALSATVLELQRPMTLLKGQGRVRSVGPRSATRYFPVAA